MSLKADICRCHDSLCPMRDSCQRWIYRNDKGERVVHAATLMDLQAWLSRDKCDLYIEAKRKDD